MEENNSKDAFKGFSIKSFLKSLFGYSMASWVQALVAFITIPIVTRIFSTDEYGKINMLVTAATVAVVIVRLSTEQSYIRFFIEREDYARKRLLTLCVTMNLVMFAVLYILAALYTPLSATLIGEDNRLVMLVFLPTIVFCSALSEYQRIYFKMQSMVGLYILYALIYTFANKISIMFAAFSIPDYSHAMGYMAISLFAGFILMLIICPRCFSLTKPTFDKAELRTVVSYSLPFLPVSLLQYLNAAVSSFILKSAFDFSTLAMYSATVSISNVMEVFQSGFSIVWGPFVYQNYQKLQDVIKKIHTWLTLIMSIIVILLMMVSDILFLILGPKYRAGSAIFGLLVLPHMLTVIAETTCYGIYLSKKTHLQIYATVLSAGSNILFSLWLIPSYGILGAAIANLVGSALSFTARTYFGQREYVSTSKFYKTLISIVIVVIAGVCSYAFDSNLLMKEISLALLLGTVVLIYIGEIKALFKRIKTESNFGLRFFK